MTVLILDTEPISNSRTLFHSNLQWLTIVEDVAWRFPDVRQNDIVLAKPLSVKQETHVILPNKHQTLLSHHLDFIWQETGRHLRADDREFLPQEFGEPHPELTQASCITRRETETLAVTRTH